MSDRLDPGALAGVLREVAENRKEGVVRVRTDGAERAIFFRNGFIVRVDSDAAGESLAETVERVGKVKRVDLELAMTVMKQTSEGLGKTLIEMSLLAPDDVAALELERAQSILRSLLAQTGGALQFDERALAMGTGDEVVRLSVDQLVPKPPPAPQRTAPRPWSSKSTPPPSKSPSPSPKPASMKSRNVRPRVAEKPSSGGGGRILFAAVVLGVVFFGSILLIRGGVREQDGSPRKTAEASSGPESASTPAVVNAVDGDRDAELFAEATLAFAGDDLETSKATLETLLERSPDFVGARELLARVDERLANPPPEPEPVATPATPSPAKPEPEPEREPPNEAEPSLDRATATPRSAQQLHEAKLAFDQGDLAASRQALEALLSEDPSHAGARQLLADVDDATWQSRLPLSFEVSHNHRFGGCTGTLSLEVWGVGFTSEDHAWQWAFGDMRSLDRDSRWLLNLETHESDRLSLGGGKNYKFQFDNPIPDNDWSRFQRLARR